MAVELFNVDGLPEVPAYKHVAVATGSKFIYVSGQVSWDAEGQTVGEGDLAAQIEQCFANAATALAAAGASFEDVAKMTLYVVDWKPEMMEQVGEGAARAAERVGSTATPPATLIGVAALDVPEHLVELEVVAVID